MDRLAVTGSDKRAVSPVLLKTPDSRLQTDSTGASVLIESEDDGFVEFMVNYDILTDNSGAFLVKLDIRP